MKKKMVHSPLFLEGDVFLVHGKLSTKDKKRCDVVKTKMTKAFAVTPPEAYHCFVGRRLRPDKSVNTCCGSAAFARIVMIPVEW